MSSVSLVFTTIVAAVMGQRDGVYVEGAVLSPIDDCAFVLDGHSSTSCSVALLQMGVRKMSKHSQLGVVEDPEGGKETRPQWTYGQPEEWASAFQDCGGQRQSPIDISPNPDDVDIVDSGTSTMADRVNYVPVSPLSGLEMVNNGYSLQVNGNFGELRLPDGIYSAKQFHFHFPSEHSMFGDLSAGEMHIVHQRIGAIGTDGLAVIGILLQEADEKGLAASSLHERAFFRKAGLSAGVRPGSSFPIKETLDIADHFAEELSGGFYHYEGSLTTPPCSETVHWYILKNRAAVSRLQIETFNALFPPPANNRPVQPLNQRVIVEDQLVGDPAEFTRIPASGPSREGQGGSPTAGESHDHASFHWGYGEPERWPSTYPACAGTAQSPIDIDAAAVSAFKIDDVNSSQPLSKLTTYGPVKGLIVVNNGHSVQVSGKFGELKLPDGIYDAKQFHFHFPSEHALFGELAAGELHIVHQRQGATGTDGLAVIGIMLKQAPELGFTPASMSQIELFRAMNFPVSLPKEGEEYALPGDYELDLGVVFAEELSDVYYHYQGSLTTPPCSETVHWFVLENPAAVTLPVINRFKEMFPSPTNSRPLQQLNGRRVVTYRIAVDDEEY